MGLKLEAGKRYVTRSGWITPPICEDLEVDESSSMRFYAGDESWSLEGGVFHTSEHPDDIVSEFVEVAPLPDVTNDLEHQTLEMMRKLGGDFVQHLVSAYLRADRSNQQKIRNTFREYWSTYHDLVAYGTKHDVVVYGANGGAN
jgi:hypothetical protein